MPDFVPSKDVLKTLTELPNAKTASVVPILTKDNQHLADYIKTAAKDENGTVIDFDVKPIVADETIAKASPTLGKFENMFFIIIS